MSAAMIAISEELRLGSDEIGARTGRSRAEIVDEALRTFFPQRAEPRTAPAWPRSIGMIDDPDAPPADRIDEWLEQNWRPDEDRGRS